jgi:hypothetical protein
MAPRLMAATVPISPLAIRLSENGCVNRAHHHGQA